LRGKEGFREAMANSSTVCKKTEKEEENRFVDENHISTVLLAYGMET
jgi:hypothetical protein